MFLVFLLDFLMPHFFTVDSNNVLFPSTWGLQSITGTGRMWEAPAFVCLVDHKSVCCNAGVSVGVAELDCVTVL